MTVMKYKLRENTFNIPWPEKQKSICIFTDGSKYEERVGCGAIIEKYCGTGPEISNRLSDWATVCQAELRAITLAADLVGRLDWVNGEEEWSQRVNFYVDSQAAIKSLFTTKIESRSVRDARTELNNLGEKLEVTINWIKAHQGHAKNDMADECAKAGSKLTTRPMLSTAIPEATIQKRIKEYVVKKWNTEWANYPHCRQTKLFFPTIHLGKSKKIYKCDKETFGAVVRWMTGHNGLLYHNNLINPSFYQESMCRLCNEEEETAAHLLTECPVLMTARVDSFRHRFFDNDFLPRLKINDLQTFLQRKDIKALENDDEMPEFFCNDAYLTREPSLLSMPDTDSESQDDGDYPMRAQPLPIPQLDTRDNDGQIDIRQATSQAKRPRLGIG
jgi:ribonuclease HI